MAAAAVARLTAQTDFNEEQKLLHASHRETMAKVDEWRDALERAKERTRQARQKGKITKAITQVQVRAASQRAGTADSDEDLCSETVTREWMPLLFNCMLSVDANSDVKRMALEAADKVYINQIYSEGATREQWSNGAPSSPSTRSG